MVLRHLRENRALSALALLGTSLAVTAALGTPNPENVGFSRITGRIAPRSTQEDTQHIKASIPQTGKNRLSTRPLTMTLPYGAAGVSGSWRPAAFVGSAPFDWMAIFLLVSALGLVLSRLKGHLRLPYLRRLRPLARSRCVLYQHTEGSRSKPPCCLRDKLVWNDSALPLQARQTVERLPRDWRRLEALLLSIALLTACDLLSKGFMQSFFARSIYWSAMTGQPLEVVGTVICVLCAIFLTSEGRIASWASILILAGALGNLLSSFLYAGYVPDFIVFGEATINLGDIMVCLGLLGGLWTIDKKRGWQETETHGMLRAWT